MYSTQVELLKNNGKIVLTIYQIMIITGVILAMYPIWPPRIKKEMISASGMEFYYKGTNIPEEAFTLTSRTYTPAGGRGIGLAFM